MTLLDTAKHAIILVGLMTGWFASSAFAQTGLKAGGLVTYEDERPFAKAQVTLYSAERIPQTTSDAAGHFQFDRIPFGVYQLEVASPAFKTKTVDNVNVTGFTRSEDLQFKILLAIGDLNADCGRRDKVSYAPAIGQEGNVIMGMVLLEPLVGKSPVANARVTLLSDQGVKLGEQITNEQGQFRFRTNVPGRYLIEMTHPSFNLLRSTVFWTARENRTHLFLDPVPVGKIIVCQ